MNRAKRERLLQQAQELAEQRATVWRTFRRTRSGELLGGWKLHRADTPRKRANLLAKGAHPVLPTREWYEIYQEVGLPA